MNSHALYDAVVVHRRVRPVAHELRYHLTYGLFDVDRLGDLHSRSRLFSYNRFNLFSLHDKDHGPRDGTAIATHVARTVAQAGMTGEIERTMLLCLPRMAGYVFNPLSVYYCLDSDGTVRLMIYEVSNTFGERKSYVLPAVPDRGSIRQACAKRLYVSPFNDIDGTYDFTACEPGERVRLGIGLSTAEGPLLSAHLVGKRRPLDDRALLSILRRQPAMTWKVIAGIHWEALKLWRKGLRLRPRHPAEGQAAGGQAAGGQAAGGPAAGGQAIAYPAGRAEAEPPHR